MDDNKEYKGIRTAISIIGLLILAAALGLMGFGLVKGFMTSKQGNILMGSALVIYWILTDIVEPVVTHRFDDITNEQRTEYYKFILFDLAGYGGLAYFLFGVGQSSSGILGAAIYVAVMRPKRQARDLFYGIAEPEEEDETESEEAQKDVEVLEGTVVENDEE